MRSTLCLVVALLQLCGSLYAQSVPSDAERAISLRRALEAVEAAQRPSEQLYLRYLEVFPESFADLREWFVAERFRDVLSEGRRDWDYGADYRRLMCKTFRVDSQRYMRKLLRMGIEANNWGGPAEDELLAHVPGEMYQALVYGNECEQPTQASMNARMAIIYQLLPQYSDREVEAIYNSLAWGGAERFALKWFLDGACRSDAKRCALMRTLRKKYVESLEAEPAP